MVFKFHFGFGMMLSSAWILFCNLHYIQISSEKQGRAYPSTFQWPLFLEPTLSTLISNCVRRAADFFSDFVSRPVVFQAKLNQNSLVVRKMFPFLCSVVVECTWSIVMTPLVIVDIAPTFYHGSMAMVFLFYCSTWLYNQPKKNTIRNLGKRHKKLSKASRDFCFLKAGRIAEKIYLYQ